jgi:nitroreductase
MSNAVLTAIADRRSIRSYKPEQITQEQLDALLQAAQESPSAGNSQPWYFTVVQKKEIIDEINAELSKVLDRDVGDVFYGAPTVIFISADPEARWARYDTGIATQTIALAAHSLGLGSIILGFPEAAFTGPNAAHFAELLKFPEGKAYSVAIGIGTPAGTKDAHEIKPDKVTIIA